MQGHWGGFSKKKNKLHVHFKKSDLEKKVSKDGNRVQLSIQKKNNIYYTVTNSG